MSTRDEELLARVGTAYLMLRSLRNCARDALAATAALQTDLEAFAAERGVILDPEAQPKEAQPNGRKSPTYLHNARRVA